MWTVVVVAGIYSTLGLARTLENMLRARGLLDMAFVVAALLILVTVVTLTVARQPGGAEVGVTIGVVVVYLLLTLRAALPEERTHLMEYGVVAAFIHEALLERARHGRGLPVPGLLAIGLAALVGVVDELLQAAIPFRVFDPLDIVVNVVAAALAVAARAVLSVGLRIVRSGRG